MPRSRKTVSMRNLIRNLLPEDYQQKNAKLQQLQHFFSEYLGSDEAQSNSSAINPFKQVKVLNVSSKLLSVAVPGGSVATYLKIHRQGISQALNEYFGCAYELSIQPRPDLFVDSRAVKRSANPASEQATRMIQVSALHQSDPGLSEALQSLARTLQRTSKKGKKR